MPSIGGLGSGAIALTTSVGGGVTAAAVFAPIFVVVGAAVAYSFSEEIFQILTSVFYENFKGGSLIGTGPAEAFMLKLKVAVFAGVILMSPAILFQVWKFKSGRAHV